MALADLNVTQNVGQKGTIPGGQSLTVFEIDADSLNTFTKGSLFISNGTGGDISVFINEDAPVIVGDEQRTVRLGNNVSRVSIESETAAGTYSYFFNLNQQVDFEFPPAQNSLNVKKASKVNKTEAVKSKNEEALKAKKEEVLKAKKEEALETPKLQRRTLFQNQKFITRNNLGKRS